MKLRTAISFVIIAGVIGGLSGCGEKDVDPNAGLPPAKLTPDASKPPSVENPAAGKTNEAL